MVEQFIDVRMASISIDEIANEQVNDTIGESSFLGGLSGDATVATISGFKLVKSLIAGDLVLSQDNGYVPIKTITKIASTQYQNCAQLVVIGQGSLGVDFPVEDLIVASEQLILVPSDIAGSDMFVRAGDLVRNSTGVRFISSTLNTYILNCDGHEAILVNGHWMGTGYSSQSYTMMTLDVHQAQLIGLEFTDVRPLCRVIYVPTADKGNRRMLRVVR
jgi:hypothetical protein